MPRNNLFVVDSNRQTYKENDVITFEIDTPPEHWIDGNKSYISFKFTTNTDESNISFAGGSAMNIFRRCQVISPEGTILDDLNQLGFYSNYKDHTQKSTTYTDNQSMGELKGYGNVNYNFEYQIDLKDFSSLFQRHLMTPLLTQKMRIRLEVDDTYNIFTSDSDTTKIQVSQVRLNLKAVYMPKNQEDYKKLFFRSYKTYRKNYQRQGEFNFPHRLTKATKAIGFIQPKLDNITQKFSFDYSTAGYFLDNLRSYRFKVGSSYYPNSREIRSPQSAYKECVNNLDIKDNSLGLADFDADIGAMTMDLTDLSIHPSKKQLKLSIKNKSTAYTDWDLTWFVEHDKVLEWDTKTQSYKMYE